MRKPFILTILVIVSIFLFGCTKEEETGTIYGTVTDYATGEPIKNASVQLRPDGTSVMTGSDGFYAFKELKPGEYSLFISHADYKDTTTHVQLAAGKTVSHDVRMKRNVSTLRITDLYGNDIAILDFGAEQSVTSKSFNIFNNGSSSIVCSLSGYQQCGWISNVTSVSAPIAPNQTIPVTVEINRSQLSSGVNTTLMQINSDNGSAELQIRAEGIGPATITTTDPTSITTNSAFLGGVISSDNGSAVTDRGVCWGCTQAPSLESGDHLSIGQGTGNFAHTITGLVANTPYYVRAYATNGYGTSYGEEKAFTTLSGLPEVTTATPSNVMASTATCGGNVTGNGGFPVTARGVCWNALGNPDTNDTHTYNGTGNGTFTANITGLTPGTTYYVRAYASNSMGTSYGGVETFSTTNGWPNVSTQTPSNVLATTATGGGNVGQDGGFPITARGICWNTQGNPDINDPHTTNGTGTGLFDANMTGLTPSTTYHVRAYATNSQGTNYGQDIPFTTFSGLPAVSISSIDTNNITSTSAVLSGNVNNDYGSNITERGFCWSIYPYPTISDSHITVGLGTGPFTGTATNLTRNTTYYVRAYAINSYGINYSASQQSFQTKTGLPTVTTTNPTRNGTTVTSGGNVISDGGYPVTARGICWSTAPYPDLSASHNHTTNGTGSGSYSSSFEMPGQGVYYIRAYATNANGTSYGEQQTINHPYNDLPTFTYNGFTYRVAPPATTSMHWSDANDYCNNLTLYGYSDWRLPTLQELLALRNFTNTIGGWGSSSTDWWSCSVCSYYSDSDGHYVVRVIGSSSGLCRIDNEYLSYVRAIRVEN